MKPEKVELESTKDRHDRMSAFNKSISYISITKSLPYYKSARGQYVHRVRSGIIHFTSDKVLADMENGVHSRQLSTVVRSSGLHF